MPSGDITYGHKGRRLYLELLAELTEQTRIIQYLNLHIESENILLLVYKWSSVVEVIVASTPQAFGSQEASYVWDRMIDMDLKLNKI